MATADTAAAAHQGPFAHLPFEIVDVLLNGTDASGKAFVHRSQRAFARLVCRRWAAAVESPSDVQISAHIGRTALHMIANRIASDRIDAMHARGRALTASGVVRSMRDALEGRASCPWCGAMCDGQEISTGVPPHSVGRCLEMRMARLVESVLGRRGRRTRPPSGARCRPGRTTTYNPARITAQSTTTAPPADVHPVAKDDSYYVAVWQQGSAGTRGRDGGEHDGDDDADRYDDDEAWVIARCADPSSTTDERSRLPKLLDALGAMGDVSALRDILTKWPHVLETPGSPHVGGHCDHGIVDYGDDDGDGDYFVDRDHDARVQWCKRTVSRGDDDPDTMMALLALPCYLVAPGYGHSRSARTSEVRRWSGRTTGHHLCEHIAAAGAVRCMSALVTIKAALVSVEPRACLDGATVRFERSGHPVVLPVDTVSLAVGGLWDSARGLVGSGYFNDWTRRAVSGPDPLGVVAEALGAHPRVACAAIKSAVWIKRTDIADAIWDMEVRAGRSHAVLDAMVRPAAESALRGLRDGSDLTSWLIARIPHWAPPFDAMASVVRCNDVCPHRVARAIAERPSQARAWRRLFAVGAVGRRSCWISHLEESIASVLDLAPVGGDADEDDDAGFNARDWPWIALVLPNIVGLCSPEDNPASWRAWRFWCGTPPPDLDSAP